MAVNLQVDDPSPKKTAEALSDSEARYRSLFDAVPSAVFVCDASAVIQDYNRRAAELWGREPKRGDPNERYCGLWRLYLPDGTRMAHEDSPIVEVIRTGQRIQNLKEVIERPDGSRITVRVSFAPLRNSRGEITGAITSFDDITDYEQVQEELRESEDRFRTLVEQASDGIFLSDAAGRYVDVNPAGCQMLGYSQEEVCGLSIREIVAPEEAERVESEIAHLFEGNAVRSEWRFRRQDGSFFHGEVSARQLPDCRVLACIRDTTERRRAVQSLEHSRGLLQSFVENTPAAVAMLDNDLRYVAVSKRWLQDYQLGDRDLIGAHHYDWFPEIRAMPDWQAVHRRCLAGAVERREEDRFVRTDGHTDWVRWEVRPWRDEKGAVGGIIIFTEVITERKRAEEAIRESEKKYRDLVETSQDLIWSVDLEGRWTFVNRRGTLAIYGYEPKDMLGRPFAEFQTTKQSQVDLEAFAAIKAGRPVFGYETQHINKDGHPIVLSFNAIPLLDVEGRVVGATGTAHDITERKRAEEVLRESEARLRTLLENLENVAVQACEPDGTITFWNKGSEKFYGYSAAEALGSDLVELLYGEPTRDEERRIMADAMRSGEVPAAEEMEVLRRDGSKVNIFASRILHPRPGKTPEFFCFDVDTTDRKRAEEELALRQAKSLHAARLSTVGEMVAALSHEVSQPLSAIGNFAAASARVLESMPAKERATLQEYTQAIMKQNQRCGAILQRLRDFSRRTHAQRSSCDLNQLLRDAVELVSNELRGHDVGIQFELASELPPISCDRIQIEQVIVNLLTNARDALCDQPIARRTITIHSRAEGAGVVFEVADRGSGLSEEVARRLFEPFFTTKATGMGVGLSICKTIVLDHGGQIEALRNEAGGATFRVRLPLPQECGHE